MSSSGVTELPSLQTFIDDLGTQWKEQHGEHGEGGPAAHKLSNFRIEKWQPAAYIQHGIPPAYEPPKPQGVEINVIPSTPVPAQRASSTNVTEELGVMKCTDCAHASHLRCGHLDIDYVPRPVTLKTPVPPARPLPFKQRPLPFKTKAKPTSAQ